MHQSKLPAIIFSLVILGILSAISAAAYHGNQNSERSKLKKEGKTVLRLGHGLSQSHPVHLAMVDLAKRVKEKSNGQMDVLIYPSGQFGSERTMIEQVQLNQLEMTKTSAATLESFVPEVGVLSLPYIFRNSNHYWNVLNGQVGNELDKYSQKKNFHILCFFDAGARSFYSKESMIKSPADLKRNNLKVRVMKSKKAMQMIKAMGGSPTPISWGELYSSLQQGVVDAAENNPPSFLNSRHYEVCKYYSLDKHARIPDIVIMSQAFWKSLSEQQKNWLTEAAKEASAKQRKDWETASKNALKELKKAGVEIYTPDPEPFIKATQKVRDGVKNPAVKKLLNQIEEAK